LPAFRWIVTGACLLGAAIRGAAADVVIDWNVAMTHYSEIQPPPGLPPFVDSRVFAMAHLAMLDAFDEAKGGHAHNWQHHGPASAEAAIAQAAHDVLVNQFPGGTADFDALLATQLAAIPNSAAKTRGLAIGADSAADQLASRANDGSATPTAPYTPGPNPGDYRFTPPFDGPPFNGFADAVLWGKVKPFAMKRGSQFRAPPPYKVTDLAYTFDFNEIKVLGALSNSSRSGDQTDLALFWYENSSFGWNRVARVLDASQSHTLAEHVHLFASLNAAIADAYIASIESKYTYNFWRPITAIRLAATDGNDQTAADPAWDTLFLTPPVPDYPSAHSAAGGAAAAVLISFFGDENTFTFQSTMSFPFPQIQPRTFHRISDAAKENALSRMLVGIHFRLACEMGLEQGYDVGSWVVRHGVRP
jgi:hypothetical protein